MDATAVAAARGMLVAKLRPRDVALVGGLFGGFQALMPALGYALGGFIPGQRWIGFAVLVGVGGKMLWDARQEAPDDTTSDDPFDAKILLALAVATSLDAFAAGITLPLLGMPLVLSVCVIGVVTAALSITALFVGRHLGHRLGAFGGLILIALGIKLVL